MDGDLWAMAFRALIWTILIIGILVGLSIGVLVSTALGAEPAPNIHLIFYTASWCGPCKKAHAELENNDFYNSLNPESVDPDKLQTEDERAFFKAEKVDSFPTFVIYREFSINGRVYLKEMGRFEGYSNVQSFTREVNKIIGGAAKLIRK